MNKKVLAFLLLLILSASAIFYYGVIKKPKYRSDYSDYNRIVGEAAKSEDPSICETIDFGQNHGDYRTPAEELRYFCRSDYAVEIENLDYCRSLDKEQKYTGAITQRNKCLRGLAIKLKKPELCNEMLDPSGERFTQQTIKGCKQRVSSSSK